MTDVLRFRADRDSTDTYVPNRRLSMKAHPTLTEEWLQGRIIEEPEILGLGKVDVKDSELVDPGSGRLELLLYDAEATTRYELDLQLGPTDETHIIRAVEHWDIERRRYPQYDHVGVIVAEEITARFFNFFSLLNGFIPLVAMQVSAIEVNGALTLVFTKVLDTQLRATEEEESSTEPRDGAYWEHKATVKTMAMANRLFSLVYEADPGHN